MSSIHEIAVIGGGTMGQGIAELLSKKGFEVTLLEQSPERAEQARHHIEISLDKQLAKWGITAAEKKGILSRIRFTTDFESLKNADLVIESVYEDLDVKKDVFVQCDRICRPEVILASNTSTLSLTEIAAATERPDRVIGLHFVHPVAKVDVVEIIRGLKTSNETFETIRNWVKGMDLVGIEVYESPGFVTTRLSMLLINEAIHTLMEGVASAEEIDLAMKRGYKFPMGPLEMADHFGLDSVLKAMERLFREYGDTKYRPAPLLKKMVRAGHLGVKTGEGFFRYNEDGERLDRKDVR
ncbi:3-hydroxybutyryl-CoA dehydrogenase [Polycladomyces abyssicola]|uniref:3-hydroxybutyryl-CoA dehydrogenase n=1 Tax=Polycladomyces abyssicola TaxID=1125966 RepID=A0A8D5UG52_9BACL|nr:3-hydroxyacyl-CoA dehydrogenase NAD-binding domain-containing protein [Polycladomyces abyssicola]BCU81846.1 3-hydroxybutyryl-CoA dehydrogenase [Polycladomyces abyssicola]